MTKSASRQSINEDIKSEGYGLKSNKSQITLRTSFSKAFMKDPLSDEEAQKILS